MRIGLFAATDLIEATAVPAPGVVTDTDFFTI